MIKIITIVLTTVLIYVVQQFCRVLHKKIKIRFNNRKERLNVSRKTNKK